MTKKRLRLAVIGYPVKHSLSPRMQNAALEAAGIADRFHYEAVEVAPEGLQDFLDSLDPAEWAGINITIPHKVACFDYVRRHGKLTESVAGIDAINTIALSANSAGGRQLKGYNTDAEGFTSALEQTHGVAIRDKVYFQVGAGGAGRAMAVGMARAGAKKVIIANRTQSKVEDLAAQLERAKDLAGGVPAHVEIAAYGMDDTAIEAARTADILANATSLGMKPDDPSPLPSEAFRAGQVAYDSIYLGPNTPFRRTAREAGAAEFGGLSMLAWQGTIAFRHFTGHEADASIMLQTLEAALAKSNK